MPVQGPCMMALDWTLGFENPKIPPGQEEFYLVRGRSSLSWGPWSLGKSLPTLVLPVWDPLSGERGGLCRFGREQQVSLQRFGFTSQSR